MTSRYAAVLLLALGLAPLASAQASAPALANGYFRLTPSGGGRVAVAFDPTGKGHYATRGATLSALGSADDPACTTEVTGGALRVTGARYVCPGAGTGGYPGPFDHGQDLSPTGSLGQTFTVAAGKGWLWSVWALLTASGVANSAVTMTLRRDGPAGPVLAQRRVRPLPEDARVDLDLPRPAPPGVFYLEISHKQGGAYWWGCNTDVLEGGEAYISGVAQPHKDWCFGYTLADVGAMSWQARPVGKTLRCSFTVTHQAARGFTPALALSFPWRRAGFDTTNPAITPFDYIYTDQGQYMAVQAFKRYDSYWALQPACHWFRMHGTGGYDLQITHGRPTFVARMDPHRIHLLLGPASSIEVAPPSAALPRYFPRFLTPDAKLNATLNSFLLAFLTRHTSCPSSYEWDALKLAWVGGPIHESFRRVLLYFTHRVDPDGYIWSRPNSRGWDGTDATHGDSRHYDSNAPWILACWRMYEWTGNRAFLKEAMPTVRRATDYLLGPMHGRDGLLTIDSPQHTGICKVWANSWPSSYFDCIPAGYRDAYVNAFYLPALVASAQLERAAGNASRAAELAALVARARRAYNREFWDARAGRYVSWVDADGKPHDFGMTYVNDIAATYGLPDAAQVRRMFHWMQTEPTSSGKPDTFTRWVFAPRCDTKHCDEQWNRMKYDDWCEDGGTLLWTAFYEVMARARYLGADNAWARFRQILDRYALPDHLIGGYPLYRGETAQQVGPWGECPEDGIAPCAFLYAFVGVRADDKGLHVRPNLPAGLAYAGVDGLMYHGHRLTLIAHRGFVTVDSERGRRVIPVRPGGEALITDALLGPPHGR